jgi:hypothetical protein
MVHEPTPHTDKWRLGAGKMPVLIGEGSVLIDMKGHAAFSRDG